MKQPDQNESGDLRKRAEEEARAGEVKTQESQLPEETRRVLRESQAHQIDLEIQNEELRRAQAELEASRARYFDLYDLAPVGYATLSEKGVILEANLTAATLLRVDRCALVKQPLTRFIVPEDQDIYYRHFRQLFETSEPQAYDLRMVKKDGEALWVHQTTTVAQDDAGVSVCRVVMSDITELLRAQGAARNHEEEYHSLIERSLQGIAVLDDTGVAFANQAFAETSGYSIEELYALSVDEVRARVHPDDRERVWAIAQRRLAGELFPPGQEFRLIRKDGTVRWVESRANRILYRGKPSIQVLHVDITERRQAEEELRRRVRLAEFQNAIGAALTRHGDLRELLQQCAEIMVKMFDAAFARIWTLNPRDQMLELQASAGIYTHLDGPHGRVPVGKFKIGMIAQDRLPHLTNRVIGDPRVGDQEWARREGMVAFAGHPLMIESQVLGVVGMFARHPFSDDDLRGIHSVVDSLALAIQGKQAAEELRESEERYHVQFDNAQDAMFLADAQTGLIMDCNRAALELMGMEKSELVGTEVVKHFETALFIN